MTGSTGCGQDGCGSCFCGSVPQRRRAVAVVADPFVEPGNGVAVSALIAETTTLLRDAAVPSPAVDARRLLEHVLGVTPAQLATAGHVSQNAASAVRAAAARRQQREPLQHITGQAGFRHLELHVGAGVFVPRPETEAMVEAALAALPQDGPALVVDLGAGSGAIAISVATERPDTVVNAVEIDAAAVPWLTQNVIRHAARLRSVGSSIRVVLGDGGAVSRADQPMSDIVGKVDLVIGNPPYIPDDATPRDPEVRDYDPALALYGGPDGLDVVRRWLDTAADLLAPGAVLLLEHADLQGGDDGVPGLLARHEDVAAGGPVWRDIADHEDLTGRSRFTSARRL